MLQNKNKMIIETIFYMILASSLIAGTTILAKMLGTNKLGPALNPMQISNARFFFAFVIITIILLITRNKIKNPNIKLHIARSMCGWIGISILFAGSSIIPVSDATALVFTKPIFAMLLAIPLLGEKVKLIKWIAAFITFFGAVILIRPENNMINLQPIALLLLFGAAIMGLESILIKMLTNLEKPIPILFVNNGIGLLISSTPLYWVWQSPNNFQLIAMFGIGALMLCAQSCFIQALKRSDANFVVPYFYSALIFVIFYDFLIFKITPDYISILGASIIIFGGLIIYLSESRNKIIDKL